MGEKNGKKREEEELRKLREEWEAGAMSWEEYYVETLKRRRRDGMSWKGMKSGAKGGNLLEGYRRRRREEEERSKRLKEMMVVEEGQGVCRPRKRLIREMERHEYVRKWEEKCGWSRVELEEGLCVYVNGAGEYLNGGEVFTGAEDFNDGTAIVRGMGWYSAMRGMVEREWETIIDTSGKKLFKAEGWGRLRRLEYEGVDEEPAGRWIYEYVDNCNSCFPEQWQSVYIVRRDGRYIWDFAVRIINVTGEYIKVGKKMTLWGRREMDFSTWEYHFKSGETRCNEEYKGRKEK